MIGRSGRLIVGAVALFAVLTSVPRAQAQDFFSTLFGGFGASRPSIPSTPLPYASEGGNPGVPENGSHHPRAGYAGGAQAYCVRSCDGRYFPIPAADGQSRAASCNSFCPASETRVVYGGTIDHAVTESGKPYSELPNAFRYRHELVAGCTCNGKDEAGLARIGIENDPTLRKGDIVVDRSGLMTAGRGADRRGASLNLSPAPDAVRSHYQRVPVVASQ